MVAHAHRANQALADSRTRSRAGRMTARHDRGWSAGSTAWDAPGRAATARSVSSVHAPVLGQVTRNWTALTIGPRGGPT